MLHPEKKEKKKEVDDRRDMVNKMLIKGATQLEISNQLKISISTVERDVKVIKENAS